MRPEDTWFGASPGARIVRGLLTPASWVYALGWICYRSIYDLGLKKSREPHKPVACVGNLTVGGSGKTPLAIHIADLVRSLGLEVVLSCSGHGSPASRSASVAPEGELKASEWGDEPAMIRWLRSEMPLIVGRDRVRAAELCQERYPDAVLLLDDGFQHLPLKKHVSILIDDPAGPNRMCLPAGPYREPRWGSKRADLILPGRFRIDIGEGGFINPIGSKIEIAGKTANLLCAIGNPERFVESVRAQGLELKEVAIFSDHDPLNAGNLLDRIEPSLPIVVTAKDWVKLRERTDLGGREVCIARYELRIEPAGEFKEWLRERAAPYLAKGDSR